MLSQSEGLILRMTQDVIGEEEDIFEAKAAVPSGMVDRGPQRVGDRCSKLCWGGNRLVWLASELASLD